MSEMTAMPILPSAAPPASSLSASSGLASRTDKVANSAQAVNSASSNSEPGAAPNNDDKSFASVLQRQLTQVMPAPLPEATGVIDTNAKALPEATGVIDTNAKALPEATGVIDTNAKALPEATGVIDANARPLPNAAQMTAPKEASLTTESDDEASRKKSDDGLVAAQSPYPPYLIAFVTNPSVKLESNAPNLPITEKKPVASPEGTLLLAAATLVQSPLADTKDDPPTKLAEIPPPAANKTAEFAAELSSAPDVAPSQTNRKESSGAEGSFENLLAVAQAVNQGRNAGVHSPSHTSPSLPVQTPVGARGWDGEVSDKLVWMVGRQEQRAELVLNPPQLGRVEVSLSMSGGQTSALFVSANPAVRDALEAALPRLREILADAGVNLGQAQVGADAGSNQMANQSTNNRENWDNSRRTANRFDSANGMDLLRPVETKQWIKQANGLVDVFA
ncbi:MAG: flagellar hook-length control protein FliK [Sterolibacterium sp.]|nr:flagellar hook-length control protein FliK [Sterolibacterium sp.]